MADPEKKLIIDEDWKQKAQQEKEVMAAKEQEEKKKEAEEPEAGPGGPMPQGNFAALVSMLTTQALFALGLLRIRGEEEHGPDLEMARYNIDMLEALAAKTKGNLDRQEEKMLKDTLGDLRMGFVSVANQLASQA
ncbi:MAG: DUF1844 domain-containing protein [Phycisphaerae bacterium]|nr:DUF1844 domain-containing protein [Phycisphaerae bacterium]